VVKLGLTRFKNVLGAFAVNHAATKAIGEAVDARAGRFNADGSYMVAVTGAEVARYQSRTKAAARAAAAAEFEKLRAKKEAKAIYEQKEKEKGETDADLQRDPDYKSLAEQEKKLEESLLAAADAEKAASLQFDQAASKAADAAKEEELARKNAEKLAGETFKGEP
jgi:hypothetical protein